MKNIKSMIEAINAAAPSVRLTEFISFNNEYTKNIDIGDSYEVGQFTFYYSFIDLNLIRKIIPHELSTSKYIKRYDTSNERVGPHEKLKCFEISIADSTKNIYGIFPEFCPIEFFKDFQRVQKSQEKLFKVSRVKLRLTK